MRRVQFVLGLQGDLTYWECLSDVHELNQGLVSIEIRWLCMTLRFTIHELPARLMGQRP